MWLDPPAAVRRFVAGFVLKYADLRGLLGKTSLLLALLGEMRYYPQSPASFVRLPREQGIAYAAQEAWIQNATIKVSPFTRRLLL